MCDASAIFPGIPEDIITYLDNLIRCFKDIDSIWLFGSRANNTFRLNSDWDFFIFGNLAILGSLRADNSFRRLCVDLFVVYDGNRFESPWIDEDQAKVGRLQNCVDVVSELYVYGYRWRRVSDTEATYISTRHRDSAERLRAVRIYSKITENIPTGQST